MTDVAPEICEAILNKRRLHFDYDGMARIVEPYCHGWNAGGAEMLRAIQVGGSSRSGGFGFGKLWVVARMSGLRVGVDAFSPNDPHYNPMDSALAEIHCRI